MLGQAYLLIMLWHEEDGAGLHAVLGKMADEIERDPELGQLCYPEFLLAAFENGVEVRGEGAGRGIALRH